MSITCHDQHFLFGPLAIRFAARSHTNSQIAIPCDSQGEIPDANDMDDREILRGEILITVVEGIGKRAQRTKAVAKRAGIPEAGLPVTFHTRLKKEVRPNAPVLRFRERTQYAFSVTWRKPQTIDGDGDGSAADITHYAIELATTAPSGTYYPWAELWCGAGHAAPDFQAVIAMRTAVRESNRADISRLEAAEESKKAREEADEMEEKMGVPSPSRQKRPRPEQVSHPGGTAAVAC